MNHLPDIIEDLALILAAAGFVTLLFKKIKQPVVLGYIISGFLVGPHVNFFPTVGDPEGIKIWADIGVIFLLFGLGLEFSFRKLIRVGPSASITALFEVIFMLGLGYVVGLLLGWSNMDSIFLGGILSISSTTIIIRAFEELGLKSRKFVNIVFGILVVEDLVAILLLVLLSSIAVTQKFQGMALLNEGLKLFFFIGLWFICGIFFLPTFLKRARLFLNSETLLVVSVGMCLGMVLLSSIAGFSPALGAFVMGSLFAETSEGKRIEELIAPVRDLFAAVFFVSVGMLIEPQILVEHPWTILILVIVTILGKFLSTTLGALTSGQSLRHSVQAGMSLAQIGEFSFIIAGLGMSLGVTSAFLYPMAVAISCFTTFTTPYLIRYADPFASFVQRKLPRTWVASLEQLRAATQEVESRAEWKNLLRWRFQRVILNLVIVFAFFWATESFLAPRLETFLSDSDSASLIAAAVAFAFALPFLWALSFGGTHSLPAREMVTELHKREPIIVIDFVRAAFGLFVTALLIGRYVPWYLMTILLVSIILLAFFTGATRVGNLYRWFERRFIANLADGTGDSTQGPSIAPWDAHIATFDIDPNVVWAGSTLLDLGVREKYGVTIAVIERGKKKILAPSRHEKLFPSDRISVIGTDEQLSQFKQFLTTAVDSEALNVAGEDVMLQSIRVPHHSPLVGTSIRESSIRNKTSGLIVGIERKGLRILNPGSEMEIESGDLLWIVGERSKLQSIL